MVEEDSREARIQQPLQITGETENKAAAPSFSKELMEKKCEPKASQDELADDASSNLRELTKKKKKKKKRKAETAQEESAETQNESAVVSKKKKCKERTARDEFAKEEAESLRVLKEMKHKAEKVTKKRAMVANRQERERKHKKHRRKQRKLTRTELQAHMTLMRTMIRETEQNGITGKQERRLALCKIVEDNPDSFLTNLVASYMNESLKI